MRVSAIALALLAIIGLTGCTALDWVGLGSDEEAPEMGEMAEGENAGNGELINNSDNSNLIPERPINNDNSNWNPNAEARDPNNPIPRRPWEAPYRGDPNEPARVQSPDNGYLLLQYLSANSIKDSEMPWYNRWERSLSETVEDVNMHYKRLLPPLNPGR